MIEAKLHDNKDGSYSPAFIFDGHLYVNTAVRSILKEAILAHNVDDTFYIINRLYTILYNRGYELNKL